jgi:ABC-type nickel/cobalt efflux system permease component RcnA
MHPVDEAARGVEWASLARVVGLAGVTAAQLADWLSVASGALAVVYGAAKLLEWWELRQARKHDQRTHSAILRWAEKQGFANVTQPDDGPAAPR